MSEEKIPIHLMFSSSSLSIYSDDGGLTKSSCCTPQRFGVHTKKGTVHFACVAIDEGSSHSHGEAGAFDISIPWL
jgi:hypothetical protein